MLSNCLIETNKQKKPWCSDHSFSLESIGYTDRYTKSSLEVNCMGWIVFSIVSALLALAIPVIPYSRYFN